MEKRSSRDFFMEIWAERPHYSEISGIYLGEEPLAQFFSHICGKGAHPSIKFNKRNIMLMTFKEHRIWEFSDPVEPKGPMWDKVFERKEEMKALSAQAYKLKPIQ